MLTLVATPIGNLGDLAPRAIAALQQADLILAEDTRRFGILAAHFGIKTRSRSFHDHNEERVADEIIALLKEGKAIALVSDAGTPLVSDPGFRLVRAVRAAGLPVTTVPGPCAAIAALVLSGFEIERFRFDGFLPRKPSKRRALLTEILNGDLASVIYESPYRVRKTVADIAQLSPNAEIMLARELTKLHEELLSGPAHEIAARLDARGKILGECVIVIRRSQGEENAANSAENADESTLDDDES